ncbi:hypothetical protein WN944_000868 [Citrus x changshan-huyou]|uniref:non-specific serine/threonine protein kinase n=1 Tax=Citrus x changshan-huyou TaxID=2935761 RepID=A0AAP0QQN5_9ROSI
MVVKKKLSCNVNITVAGGHPSDTSPHFSSIHHHHLAARPTPPPTPLDPPSSTPAASSLTTIDTPPPPTTLARGLPSPSSLTGPPITPVLGPPSLSSLTPLPSPTSLTPPPTLGALPPSTHSDSSPSSSNPVAMTPPLPSTGDNNGGEVSTGLVVGLAIGGLVVIVVVTLLILCCRKKMRGIDDKVGYYMPPPHPAPKGFSKSTFIYEELARATDGFSDANLLGQGSFGYVYKGVLPNGKDVAIKQLKSGSGQGERKFQAKVEIFSRVHHKHLVSLVGCHTAGSQRMLVYEFVPNNTLEFHLHGSDRKHIAGKGRPTMDWPTRLKIALGHPKIIHRDIKAANILLDFKFEAKVADFGLAKIAYDVNTHVSTRVMGTFGCLSAPFSTSLAKNEPVRALEGDASLADLNEGIKPGQSYVYKSSGYDTMQYNEDLKKFRKMTLNSQESSANREYSGPTNNYGGDSQMNALIWYSWLGGIIIGTMISHNTSSIPGSCESNPESVRMTVTELEENLKEGMMAAGGSSKKNLVRAKVVGIACDVCEPADVQKLSNFAVNELGSIDIWINNAGTNKGFRPLLQFTNEEIEQLNRLLLQKQACRPSTVALYV